MTTIHAAVHDYLRLRRSLGFKLVQHGQLLPGFADFLADSGAEHLTSELALAWATAPAGAQPGWHRLRLGVVRGFATYLRAIDPAHQVPAPGLLARGYDRPTPYLFTAEDVTALTHAAGDLSGRLRAATYKTYIALLAVTGIRPGEAIALDCDDVDPIANVLTVTDSKYGKSRRLLLHPRTTAALTSYIADRDRYCRRPAGPALFVSATGHRLWRSDAEKQFRALADRVGLRPRSARCRPVPMGLRHSFAVSTLIGWYHAGVDVQAHLPALSTWLGHEEPKNTYWYLQASPELLALAADRMTRTQQERENQR
jgi:integrase